MEDNNVVQEGMQVQLHHVPEQIHVYEEEMHEMQDWQTQNMELQDDAELEYRLQEMDDGLYRSQLLDDKKRFGDSKLMKAVKADVGQIDKWRIRHISEEEIDQAATAYYNAISSCDKYIASRKSDSETGSRRRDLVETNRTRLIREYELLAQLKDLMASGRFDGFKQMNLSLGDLLCRAKLYRVAAHPAEAMGEEVEGNSVTTDPELTKVLRAFKVDSTPIKKQKDRENYSHDIGELFRELRVFPVGKFYSAFVTIGGVNVIIKQDEHGTVTISNNSASVVMKESAQKLLGMLEKKMIEEQDKMLPEYVKEAITELRADTDFTSGEGKKDIGDMLTARAGITRFLELKTGIPSNNFANIDIRNLRWVCYGYLNGTDEATLKTILAELFNKSINEEKKLVNNAETLELLKQTSKLGVEVNEKVVIQRQQEQPAIEDERESKIRNFTADLIFSSDTWEADETAYAPGERVRRVLLKNSDTLAMLIKESYPDGGNEVDLERIDENIMQHGLFSDSLNEETMDLAMKGDIVRVIKQFRKDDYRDAQESEIKEDLERILESGDPEVLEKCIEIDDSVEETVDGCSELLQMKIASSVEEVFGNNPEPEQPRQIPPDDPVYYQDGTIKDPEEKRISNDVKKLRLEAEVKELNKQLEETMKGDSGQGLFIKKTFSNYFSGANIMDRRNMFASAVRASKQSTGDIQKDSGVFLGGIMKGAGPLFQKIMQGLPTAGLTDELREALDDMKSKLAPIPDEIVKAQLLGIVKRSKGKVERIEVSRALGAASVGQTFLCKMYGPKLPQEGKDVVVKLLKPDVRNRMMREKEIMLKCASETDEGMKSTYLGQLERIEEELDLTIEARNVVKGEIYDGNDGIRSMKLDDLVEPTINSMVLEKAPGTTVDRYMKDQRAKNEIRQQRLETLDETTTAHEIMVLRKEITSQLASLVTRQKYMARLSDKWVTEGIFGKGFYHGDLHAGNIMINDEGLTVIDFGNATSLTDEQKLFVTRMVGAAAVGDSSGFQDGLHSLLKPEFEGKYAEKKKQLASEIRKVFELGDKNAAGQRIALALMKAQELGIEVPSAIYNFSQCQLRLQNAVDEMCNEIDVMKNQLEELDKKTVRQSDDVNHPANLLYDSFCNIASIHRDQDNAELTVDKRIKLQLLQVEGRCKKYCYDDLELNRESLSNGDFYKENFEGCDNAEEIQSAIDSLCKFLDEKGGAAYGQIKDMVKPITGFFDPWILAGSNAFSEKNEKKAENLDSFRKYLEKRKDQWMVAVDAYKTMTQELEKNQDQAARDAAMTNFLEEFKTFGPSKIFRKQNAEEDMHLGHSDGGAQSLIIIRSYLRDFFGGKIDADLENLALADDVLGPQLLGAARSLLEYDASVEGNMNVGEYYTRLDEILFLATQITSGNLKPLYKDLKTIVQKSVNEEVQNFVDVMGKTITDHYKEALSRLGVVNSIVYQLKL